MRLALCPWCEYQHDPDLAHLKKCLALAHDDIRETEQYVKSSLEYLAAWRILVLKIDQAIKEYP